MLNVIIFRNDELVENCYDFKLVIDNENYFNANYIIGNLSINDNFSLDSFRESPVKSINFLFKLLIPNQNGSIYKNYKIEMNNKTYLLNNYLIIRIYDIDDKKNRKKLKKQGLRYNYNLYTNGIFKLNF
jgi:hypothetical protein